MKPGLACVFLVFLYFWAGAAGAAAPVGLVRFSEVAVRPVLSVPATVVSLNRSELAAETRGRILAIEVRVGDRVQAGDLLVRLDCRAQRNALQRARAALEQARAAERLAERELERARGLVDAQNISRELLDQRENALLQARAAGVAAAAGLADAELEVSRCRVSAPFEGLVLDRLASVGELAVPGTPLLQLLDTARLEVVAEVPLSIPPPTPGDEVWLEVDGRSHPLKPRGWVDAVETRSRTRQARWLFKGTPALPGSPGRVLWRSRAPHVPADLLVRRNGQLGVFIAQQGHARFLALPGASEGHPAPAPALAGDVLLVREGRHGLEDDEPIEAR